MEPAILAQNLTKHFDDFAAVDDLSLGVQSGEIFGLVGPDGAGKTTTLRMLSSIMDPSSGNAFIAGYNVSENPDKVKDNLAYMSQRFGLYTDLTVQENIEFYADLYGLPKKGRAERIDELLGFSYMLPFKKRRAGNLSGGMKQKLQLVCALVHTPKVLLLDEPTNGVDPLSRRDFWRILYKLLKQDVAILVTTAYLDEAERCNRVGLLDHGKLLAVGTPPEVKKLMKGSILSIRSRQAREINNLFRKDLDCISTEVFGDNIHIVCKNIETVKKDAIGLIEKSGLDYSDIREAAPSLEDVFVSVLSEKQTDNNIQEHQNIIPEDQSGENKINTSNNDAAVRVKNLTRRFGHFIAVDNISFEVPKGEIFGFLGPNGAGKSTTIRMLCGLLSPSDGKGLVAGLDIKKQAEKIKTHIGYMSQKFSLYEDLTVEENINFYGGIYGLRNNHLEKRKTWAIEMSGLREHRNSLTSILSGGWKQRLAMACAILHEPPIIFLDEPTSGVDPLSRRTFWDLIYAMADKGVTVFVTTHYMEEAEYCDRIALIYRGKMIALGTPLELKTQIMKDHILNIDCQKPQDIREHLSNLPEVKEVALFGAGLHAVVEDPVKSEYSIREVFKNQDIKLNNIEKIIPNMEDVFVSLIEEADKSI